MSYEINGKFLEFTIHMAAWYSENASVLELRPRLHLCLSMRNWADHLTFWAFVYLFKMEIIMLAEL